MSTATEQVQALARKLLEEGTVKVVIGYTRVGNGSAATFVTRPEDCSRLIFDETCYVNLANYLMKKEVKALGRPAIVSKGCDNRAINQLLSEKKLNREDMYVIGVECPGMDKTVCSWCNHHKPVNYDDFVPADHQAEKREALQDPTAGMSDAQRWDYWMGEFSRCIRCYACRQVCPTCYCPTCLAEKNQPQGVDSTPLTRGNFAWQLVRAFHHAGRCVECGECERACPMDIPLLQFRTGMQELIKEKFGCDPGMVPNQQAPLGTYSDNDKEDFFR